MAARKANLNDIVLRNQYINHYSKGSSHSACCKLVGISQTAGHRYIKKHSDFKRACDTARQQTVSDMVKRLHYIASRTKDPYALLKILKTLDPDWDKDRKDKQVGELTINLNTQAENYLLEQQKKRKKVNLNKPRIEEIDEPKPSVLDD